MQEIIRFHIPCRMDFHKMVEDFAEIIGKYIRAIAREEFTEDLKIVISDVFQNIVNYSNTAAQNELVRFQFELGYQLFLISIYDYGPGFKADQFFPPYPKEYIGKSYELCTTENGEVKFTVIDPVTIQFSFSENNKNYEPQSENEKNAYMRCKNLFRITKMMDAVSYSYIGHGKYDWKLIKHFK